MTESKKKPEVELVGTDGNAFAVISKCMRALWKAGYTPEEVKKFQSEAMSGDYNHVLATCMKWCDVS